MRLFILAALSMVLVAGSWEEVRAVASSSAQAPHTVVAVVREVDRLQKRLVLSNGTEVWATDVRQLDQLTEGSKVRIRIEVTGGRRTIYSIERLSP